MLNVQRASSSAIFLTKSTKRQRENFMYGSLRIDDFCTKMPFGHVTSRVSVLQKLEFKIRDFKIGDYGLPTVGREAFGTGTRQRVLP